MGGDYSWVSEILIQLFLCNCYKNNNHPYLFETFRNHVNTAYYNGFTILFKDLNPKYSRRLNYGPF